jgi:hypothetical protein
MMSVLDPTVWTPPAWASPSARYLEGEPLRIGSRWQLLAHSALIEDRRGITRVVTPPMRGGPPVVVPEHPWESRMVFGPSIRQQEKGGGFRMWYGTLPPMNPDGSMPPYLLLHAESRDGRTWEKPLTDAIPHGTSARTNIVYRGPNNNASAFAIVVDPAERDHARRYKMVYKGGRDRNGVLGEELAFSPDGLTWTPYEGNPVMPHRHDCNLNLLFDTTRKVWTAFVRPYAFSSGIWPRPRAHHRRRVAIAESPDLVHWSKVRNVLGPEEGDENEFDNIAVVPWGDVLVGVVGIFEEAYDFSVQRSHTELAFSVDGRRWERVPGRQHFISPTGGKEDFDRDSVNCSSAAFTDQVTGELTLHYNGYSNSGRGDEYTAIGTVRIPRDRFVEQRAGDQPGYLLTKEIVLEGRRLEINCRSAGQIKVELAEYPGQAIAGYGLDDCDVIRGDHLSHPVTWGGGTRDLSALRGRSVYIRFMLQDAGLWSLRVS